MNVFASPLCGQSHLLPKGWRHNKLLCPTEIKSSSQLLWLSFLLFIDIFSARFFVVRVQNQFNKLLLFLMFIPIVVNVGNTSMRMPNASFQKQTTYRMATGRRMPLTATIRSQLLHHRRLGIIFIQKKNIFGSLPACSLRIIYYYVFEESRARRECSTTYEIH